MGELLSEPGAGVVIVSLSDWSLHVFTGYHSLVGRVSSFFLASSCTAPQHIFFSGFMSL